MRNVILVTTMWSQVPERIGAMREGELRDEFWRAMLDNSCSMERFRDSRDSAWSIVDRIKHPCPALQLSQITAFQSRPGGGYRRIRDRFLDFFRGS